MAVEIAWQPIDFMSLTELARQTGFELGGLSKRLHIAQPADHWVPTGAVLVHHPSLTLSLADHTVLSRAGDALRQPAGAIPV